MRTLNWKLRIFALWMGLAVASVGVGVARLRAPGVIEDIMASDEAGGLGGIFLLVFLALAFLTLILPDRPNRWVNGVVGVLSAFVWFMNAAEFLDDGRLADEDVAGILAVLVSLFIAWHAWGWPKADVVQARPEEPTRA
jgi:hypothetical protein